MFEEFTKSIKFNYTSTLTRFSYNKVHNIRHITVKKSDDDKEQQPFI